MTNLKDAQKKGEIDKFIKEREGVEGDKKRLDKAISSMASQKKKEVQTTSRQDSSES